MLFRSNTTTYISLDGISFIMKTGLPINLISTETWANGTRNQSVYWFPAGASTWFRPPSFTVQEHVCYLSGTILLRANGTFNQHVATLAEDCRPATDVMQQVFIDSGNVKQLTTVTVSQDGRLMLNVNDRFISDKEGSVSIDGLRFVVQKAKYYASS